MRGRLIGMVLAAAVLAGCASPQSEVTRAFAVGQTFEAYPARAFDARREGFDLRWTVIAIGGQLELCGAVIVRDEARRDDVMAMLRMAKLWIGERQVLRDLSYFNTRARSFAPFTTDLATCRATGLPVPAGPVETELELNAHLYRTNG